MTVFEGVVPALNEALSKRGYSELTPVQTAVIAEELKDSDLLVSAQTGSGKTVAFGLNMAPTLLDGAEKFDYSPVPLALVVAPTRELALQVKTELEWLYAKTGAQVVTCVGGMDMRTERRALQRGAHIVVGTPGRLRDHIERGSLDTTGFKVVVLDEADEMLDLGFREDLEYILGAAPGDRRTLMFSATVPPTIGKLAKRYQRDAVRVKTTSEKEQHGDIEYRALTIAPNDRENAIINILRYYEPKNALVFCGTRMMVNHMTSRFTNRGISVVALSGELNQSQRTHALQAMRDGRAQVCIATDVAARGIDLPNLELVIHADLPKNKESLLHRSGRTGRAGRKGICALMVPHNARRRTERLLQFANVKASWAKPPSIDEILEKDRNRIHESPMLSEALTEDEQTFAAELVDRHGAEQAAAAFLRLYRAGRSAPEELLDTGPPERETREKNVREDFKDSVWFRLSVGREQNAEPRWLLPMLCRGGNLTKSDIGAIRIQPEETFVELKADCVDRFVEAIGPAGMVEETTSATRADGPPKGERGPPRGRPRDGNRSERKPRAPSSRSKRYEKYDGKNENSFKSREQRRSNPDAEQRYKPKEDRAERQERPSFRDRKQNRDGDNNKQRPQTKKRDQSWDRKDPKARNPVKRSWTTTHGKPITESADEVYARRNAKSDAPKHDQQDGAELARTADRKKKKKKVNKNKGKKRLKVAGGGKPGQKFGHKPSGTPSNGFGARKRRPAKQVES
ncbi:MAG: DEAD/DEAH box helicase [Alphaproteobacteria bacterium]|nr:DEAD/DEAH box helicase [Alphaproteobacteria bacterium]